MTKLPLAVRKAVSRRAWAVAQKLVFPALQDAMLAEAAKLVARREWPEDEHEAAKLVESALRPEVIFRELAQRARGTTP